MPGPRAFLAALVGVLLTVGALPASARLALPESVTVRDSRTSAKAVDISEMTLDASWYWDSEQVMSVTVPNGLQPGHQVTMWFDVNGDSAPDGHFNLTLGAPRKAGSKVLSKVQGFRVGGGWTLGGKKVPCSNSEDFPPAATDIRRGQRTITFAMDLWWCLKIPSPGVESGSWRAAVRVAKGKDADMAPNGRRWSPAVAGWGPCDPSGGKCP
jgi:hypothetical protein